MSDLTLRVIDGCDRGLSFDELQTPITIGREDGNTVQLNDDRVSRFHVKIQHDSDKVVLTDLDSTNGSKVNGQEIQLRILRHGDIITVGRSVLLFGSREQIEAQLQQERTDRVDASRTHARRDDDQHISGLINQEFDWDDVSADAAIHSQPMPDLPSGLSLGQAAELSEVLDYLHLRMRGLIHSVSSNEKAGTVTLDLDQWQHLVDIQSRLSEYLRKVSEPQ
jgi:pSer/pThr/pTyr-binding forkhead associated (FHA) protein